MEQRYGQLLDWMREYPVASAVAGLCLLAAVAWLANFVVKRVLVRGFHRLLERTPWTYDDLLIDHKVVARLANAVPVMLLHTGITVVPNLPGDVVQIVENVCEALIVLILTMTASSAADVFNAIWNKRAGAMRKPIKGYVQLVKILVYVVGLILMVASLIDRSPVILLSGLGAMAAVLMLVFQDTLLSLVASVQISSNGMLRHGDWIEMPQANADGDVVDIALHTVRVQNWDKTITTIPTKKFLSESFKNWRGMTESGGRRIKRSLFIDQNTVHFLTMEEVAHLKNFTLLRDYLRSKEREIEEWNKRCDDGNPVNLRRITNLGTFRAYAEQFLKTHPGISQHMTLLVRQLPLTPEGLPLELYCFTNTTAWAPYEGTQSDIFDHMLAILPEFGLRIFQAPSGADMASWKIS